MRDLINRQELLKHIDDCLAEADAHNPVVRAVLIAVKCYVELMPDVNPRSRLHGIAYDDGFVTSVTVKDLDDTLKPFVPLRFGKWKCCEPCPVCGMDRFKGLDADIWADWEPPYCPNCGARMDKGWADSK